jgi:hypothetical protein
MCWRSPRLNRKIWSWCEVKPLLTSPGVSLDEGCCDVLEESPPQQEDLVLVGGQTPAVPRPPTWLFPRDYPLTLPGVSLDEGCGDVLEESPPQQEDLVLVGGSAPAPQPFTS